MSKQNDVSNDDLNVSEEYPNEPIVEGPRMAIAPLVGKIDAVMNSYTHCNFCGGRLHFNHSSDFSLNTTHEKASCPECGLDARQVLHRLQ